MGLNREKGELYFPWRVRVDRSRSGQLQAGSTGVPAGVMPVQSQGVEDRLGEAPLLEGSSKQ